MNTKNGVFHGAVLRKMEAQLRGVMDELEHNSMVSSSTRQKMLADMQVQLDALTFGANELQRAYGKPPETIQGNARESGMV